MNALKNSVRLVGNLGSDPDFKNFGEGKDLARVAIAINERYKNHAGDWVEDTQWHNLVFWGKLAQVAKEHLSKGTLVMVDGKLMNRTYMGEHEELRQITEIRVGQLMILSAKSDYQSAFQDDRLSP